MANESATKYKLSKVYEYLYDMKWDSIDMLDYEYANDYFLDKKPVPNPGSCSSVRNGNLLGRNFDWLYSTSVEFVVKTKANHGAYATVGISGNVPTLNRAFVESKAYSDMYRMVPFMIVDGINSEGLVCTMHVTPLDYGKATGTIPEVYQKHEICSLMLPRFVLDRFSTAQKAVEYLRDYVSIYTSQTLHDQGYELHFMIADEINTYVIEFIDNNLQVIELKEYPYMTNFNLFGIENNIDGSVYTPETQHDGFDAITANGITEYGSGLERYNLINSKYSFTNSAIGMKNLMRNLWYTNTYNRSTAPFWHTEFVDGGCKVNSTPSTFESVENLSIQRFNDRERDDGLTWQTTHTSIYDFANKSVTIYVQEDQNKTKAYDFSASRPDKTSILNSVKKLLGIPEEYNHFDQDLIMHINTVFVTLTQLGAGPAKPYMITGPDEYWEDFFGDMKIVNSVKSYMAAKVRYMFDPPVGGVLTALESTIAELEWRINIEVDSEYESLQTKFEELYERVSKLEDYIDDNDLRWYTLVGEVRMNEHHRRN